MLEAVEDPPLSDLLTKADAGRLGAAVERYRAKVKELDVELRKVRAAPWPKALAKEKAKALLTGLAEASAPNVLGALTHNQHVTFPTARVTSRVYNVDTAPAAVAFMEIVDTLGLVAWAFRDELRQRCARPSMPRPRMKRLPLTRSGARHGSRLSCFRIWSLSVVRQHVSGRPRLEEK
jgi:hypothetical protein